MMTDHIRLMGYVVIGDTGAEGWGEQGEGSRASRG